MSLTQISARFFLELALGLHVALAITDRRALGPGFTRLMTALALASLLPAWLLGRADPGDRWIDGSTAAFGTLLAAALLAAGRLPAAVERRLVLAGAIAGTAALVASLRSGLEPFDPGTAALLLASSAASVLVLGLVTGAMLLGHWYLVTPDLPVAHLGGLTRSALLATYAKGVLLAATVWLFLERIDPSARAFAGVLGWSGGARGASFQSQLDFLWLAARVLIGLVGPAALCHMTLATVRLKATQPATGILYAATVMVLMGELFAVVAGQSLRVLL